MSIVTLPFAYTLSAIVRAGTVPRDMTVMDESPLMVPDIDESLAPVAAILTHADGSSTKWREVSGMVYEERRLRLGYPHPLVSATSALRGKGTVIPVRDVNLRKFLGSDRNAALLAAQEHAAGALMLGDAFLVPSVGPCFHVTEGRDGRMPYDPRIKLADPHDAVSPFLMAGAGGLAGLLAWMKADRSFVNASLTGLPRVSPGRIADPSGWSLDILREGLLDHDAEGDCLVRAARHVFDQGLTNRMVGTYPSGFLESWITYRSGEVDVSRPGEELLGLLAAAGEAAEEIVSYADADVRLRGLLDMARCVASRWEDRHAPRNGPRP